MLLVAGIGGCASEEIPLYGDPERVAGGVGGGGGGGTAAGGTGGAGGATGTGGQCEVDVGCAVSFKDTIFPVLDGTANCAGAVCHQNGLGDLTLVAGDPANYYSELTKYDLAAGPYVVPCQPEQSKLLCNLKAADGANPAGECGKTTMPLDADDAPTLMQIKQIEDWITCGAPNN